MSIYTARRLTDGEYVKGFLVYHPDLTCFAYIIPHDEVNRLHVKNEFATVKMIEVLEHTIKLIDIYKDKD